MTATRRLTAILAADVAGYSRLMGADEDGTHERLKAHLRELVSPKIAEHRGRVVKNTGDGFLAEFASVVDAVRCAVEVQRGMAERNESTPPENRIEFRIGINLGDVIVEEHDIFGDGVNVAARLEMLAEPGGMCISGTVHDHIGDRLPCAFEDMGEQSVKNIAAGSGLCVTARGHGQRAHSRWIAGHFTFAARCAAPVDRGSTLHKPQRRSGAAVFRGWDHRGPHNGSVAAREYVRDLMQYRVHL
jgi:class 3 adenylate cyclase